tara:strand:+ start:1686 stop:2870 length:1185 start_codon:yes stop_codon:yes gene_type:complete
MAYHFIFPELDTTLYSHPDRKTMNAGQDELLEIVKEPGSTDQYHYPSRILIKFKNEDIINAISLMGEGDFTSSLSSSVNLQLSVAEAKNIVSTHVLNAYAVSQSWDEGTGRYLNTPTASNGTSWTYRDNSTTATEWPGVTDVTDNFGSNGGTGSVSSSVLTPGGGTWYTGSNFNGTQQFIKGESLDTNIDVKEIVHRWSASLSVGQSYPDGIVNNGFLIKTLDSVESNSSSSFGEIQYFSSDTHTIYPPKLAFMWDDSRRLTNLFSADQIKTSGELQVSFFGNKKEYNQNEIAKFRIHIRDKYPERSFDNESNYLNVGYFKANANYSIRDAHTEREVIPFHDDFTKLSADGESQYFDLNMKGLQPERYYRILLKHINNDGTTIYDDKYFFKVVR